MLVIENVLEHSQAVVLLVLLVSDSSFSGAVAKLRPAAGVEGQGGRRQGLGTFNIFAVTGDADSARRPVSLESDSSGEPIAAADGSTSHLSATSHLPACSPLPGAARRATRRPVACRRSTDRVCADSRHCTQVCRRSDVVPSHMLFSTTGHNRKCLVSLKRRARVRRRGRPAYDGGNA